MNERDFAEKIARHLDDDAKSLPPEVLRRLQSARQQALAQVPARRGRWAWTTNPFQSPWRFAGPAFAALALAVGYVVYHLKGDSPEESIHQLEARMLAHELPPHAFHDEGFQEWLKQHPKP